MKKLQIAALVVLAFSAVFILALSSSNQAWADGTAASPAENPTFESYIETVDMSTAKVSEVIEIIATADEQERIDFLLPPDTRDLKILLNNEELRCAAKPQVGSTAVTCDFGKKISGKYSLSMSFETGWPLISFDGKLMFKTVARPAVAAKQFTFILKLPFGYIVTDPALYVTPAPDRIYSDGQRHILFWQRGGVAEFDVSVISEPIAKGPNYAPIVFVAAIIIVGLIVLWSIQRKKRFRALVYSHLIESERVIVDALEANLGVLKQKELQQITSFSKAKLSRVLKNLESRGIIEKKPRGNTFKVLLIKNPKEQKTVSEEREERG